MHIINPYRHESGGSTILVSDTFTDSDSTALASHTPDIDTAGNGWVENSGTWVISSNQVDETTNGSSQLIASIDTAASDVVVSGYVTPDSSAPARIMFRMSDTSNFWVAEAHTTLGFRIREYNSGSFSNRASDSLSGSSPYFIEVTLSGTSIIATINGANEISYTSSFNQTETKHGLCCYSGADEFDTFTVTSN